MRNRGPGRGMRLAGGGRAAKLRETPFFAMKPNTSLLRTVLVAVLLGTAATLVAEQAHSGKPAPKPAPQPPVSKPAPAAPEPVQQEDPNIEGIVMHRAKGGYLGLTLESSNFKLAFYDEKKQPVAADVTRATVRWVVHYTVFDEHAVLLPTADVMVLTSDKFVRPPYKFKLYLTLIVEGSAEPPENYVIDFHT